MTTLKVVSVINKRLGEIVDAIEEKNKLTSADCEMLKSCLITNVNRLCEIFDNTCKEE